MLSFRASSFLSLFVGCLASFASQAQGTVVITGKISGRTADSVAVSLRENPLDPKEQITYAPVSDKGEFRLALKVNGPTRADLVYNDDVTDLFLEPGYALDVRFKGNDLASSVKYKGKGAEANSYLSEVDASFVENDGFQVLPDNIMLYEAPFLSFLDYRRKQEEKFMERGTEGVDMSKAFRDYAKATITYSYANDRLTFPDLREQVVNTEGRLKMSPTYYDFLNDKALIENPSATQNELYQEFLLNYVHYLATADKHQRTDPDFYLVCYDLAKQKLSGPVKPIILGRVLQESFRFGHVKQSAAMLEDFRKIDKDNQYYPILVQDFNLHKTFAIGSPAPEFHLRTAQGDSVSLRDFAGKLVYVNFWRTTSGLSLRDLPYAVELAKKFEGKDIVFLNVALDENEGAWKQLVISRKLPGVHVRANGGMKAAIARAYGVQDVPTYILLAEDGTFLNTKPKRLSSRAAVDEIKESFGKAGTYSGIMPASSAGK
ncbi:TlpA family protein disulfide reductase [Hymenobacter defluvii]|uniref:TlpA family protein disulfide reductase n=1 Tax=Hymenobacter defluvii TaxID=2054411 RepID=A0ABS3T8Y6_9BACT|nr:TlpA disulfide reductase family protein [Hymenobacter defluvii]MBO3270109.1 TlpA family protein disulfide reductase [Hymenobacter defluvii]